MGSKILYLLTRLPDILANPALLGSSIKDGFVVYGGIIGGILTAWIYCKCTKWNFWKIFDIAMPAVAMAQGFGRIGCLLAGCCYGIELDPANPIGIVFHNSAYAPNDVALLPTQIISSVLDFANCFVLLALSKKLKTDGQVASCYLIFYSIGRFVLEYFRGDLIRGNVGEFSTSQFISLFICLIGLVLLFGLPVLAKRKELAHSRRDSAGFCIGEADFAGGNGNRHFQLDKPSLCELVADEIFDDAGDS